MRTNSSLSRDRSYNNRSVANEAVGLELVATARRRRVFESNCVLSPADGWTDGQIND